MENKSTHPPVDWTIKKLGDICFTTSGGTPNRKRTDFYGGSIPWVKSGELVGGIITRTEENITEEALQNSSAKVFPCGTLLIALYGATIGKLAFLGVDAATNQAVCGIYRCSTLNQKYLYYFLSLQRPALIKLGIGGAQPNISQTILKEIPIPYPSLPEQERIVARIEELFSDLDKGVEALQTIKVQLKVYRQAVLKKAFDGDFGSTTKTGSIKIADFADVFTGATPLTSNIEFYENGSIPWITSGELNEPTVRYARKFITEKAVAETNAKIIPKHALLLAMYGEGKTRGKCSELLIDAATNQAIASIVIKHTMHKNYVKWFLVYNYHSTRAASSGGVQPNINLSKVRDIEMPLYDYPMQEQIITEIESRLSVCDKIEQTVDESLAKAESLRQSILKKAFEGRL